MITKIDEQALVVKLNQTYNENISFSDLFDITRGIWKVHKDRVQNVQYVLGVHDYKVVSVFKVDLWVHARHNKDIYKDYELAGRSMFGESVNSNEFKNLESNSSYEYAVKSKFVDETISAKYLNKCIDKKLVGTAANPVKYFNV